MTPKFDQCVDTNPHPQHVFGLDVRPGGFRCKGVHDQPVPSEKQCRKTDPHAPHVWKANVEHECRGVQLDAEAWVKRLNWLLGRQEAKESCFCDAGWPDRECPVHFRENSYPEMLKHEAALAAPVLLEEIAQLSMEIEDHYCDTYCSTCEEGAW